MMVRISSFASTWSTRFFSALSGFPRSGKIAWKERSRPCFALPPAESPSTMKSSLFSLFLEVEAASFPTRLKFSAFAFARVNSLAFFAANLTFAACFALFTMISATVAFFLSSKILVSSRRVKFSTSVFASMLPSLVFVCPSN